VQAVLPQKSIPVKIRFPRFPVAVKFTKEGITFILLSLAIGAAAVNTGNNVLYLIFSLMLGLIVISGIFSKRILYGLVPRIEFPDHIFSSTPVVCYVTVRNKKKWIPSIGLDVTASSPSFPRIGHPFFFVPPEGQSGGFAEILFPERGIYELDEMEIQTKFPFSFFVKIQRYYSGEQVRVYPRIYRFPEEVILKFTQGTMLDSPYRGESQQLLHLRDYLPQDSSKRIHWKASARSDKLMVKEFQREQGREIRLYFDCIANGNHPGEKSLHEKGISLIASLVFLLGKHGTSGTAVFSDAEFEFGSGFSTMIPFLNYLSEIAPETRAVQSVKPSAEKENVIVAIRSRQLSPAFSFLSANARPLYIEDWLPLLLDDSKEESK
jgi:uncharacterized protein (DUF58 family)